MAKIHWSVYIIIGLFISILSYKLNFQKLVFFFYMGLIFILVGVIELAIKILNKNPDKKEETQKAQTHAHRQHVQHFKRCHRCGNAVKISERFCGRCGSGV